jgi:16S rRNA (cytidine1402-2'-O)-methyltransferase
MGTVYLLGLPIGNKDDITLRALEIIKEKNQFLVEDTRKFKQLLSALDIPSKGMKIQSYHDHTSWQSQERIIEDLVKGEDFVLASDAGSPIISDPAYPLISEALKNGVAVESIPGVTSVVTALELSGLPPHPFTFYGFFPREENKKRELLQLCSRVSGTHIFFDSPNRVEKTLSLLAEEFTEVSVSICREITKLYQSVYRFEMADWEENKDQIIYKGEFVVLIHFKKEYSLTSSKEDLNKLSLEFLENPHRNKKILSKILAELTNKRSKEIYKLLHN